MRELPGTSAVREGGRRSAPEGSSAHVRALTLLHIVAPADFGGLERVVSLLAAGHSARGHRVHVAVILPDGSELSSSGPLGRLGATDVRVHAIRIGSRSYLAERRLVARLCQRLRPDIVHTHGYRNDLLHASVARALGIPAVTTAHGTTGGGWRMWVYETLQRRSFRRSSAVVAVSQPLVERLVRSGVPASRVQLIRNACDTSAAVLPRSAARAALNITTDRPHLGWVGRLSHEKGLDVLLEALALLRDVPLAVTVIGDGEDRSRLMTQAARLRVADRLHWHGAVPDAAPFFSAFDAFVISSRTEGTPMALFEAIIAGVPVVSTNVGGIPAVVSEQEALLVPPEDPRALADAIRAVLRDAESSRLRARAARSVLAEQFAVGPWLARYEAVYEYCRSHPSQ